MRWRVPLLLILAASGWTVVPAAAEPLPERSARVVDYDIRVRLDPEAKTLGGRERIVWRNPSNDSVPDLWFHLYLNAFRNSESTMYRESGGRLRRDRASDDGWGWIDVTAMRLADGTDLLPRMTFEHPDDDNEQDRTVARVELPRPVHRGGEVEIEVEFEATLPEVYARTGWAANDFFLVGQWFPKLGVYEPAGMRGRPSGGWNCHQFHADSEFYADFGGYRVEITLPQRFVVGATGRRVETPPAENGENGLDREEGLVTHVFEQQDVHDFAWTADPSYVEVVETFSGSDDVTLEEYKEAARRLDRSLEELKLSDVEIHLLLQPEHRAQRDRYLAAAKLALKTFGLAWGRYPYATITIVDPPQTGHGAGGMEYPTFLTGGTSHLRGYWPLTRIRMLEAVVLHEIGHQWWQGLAGSNEFEESWLDEGFTAYAENLAMTAYGPSAYFDNPFVAIGGFEPDRAFNSIERRYDAMRTFSWRFSPRSWGFYSYAKPTMLLETLSGLLGETTFARVLRTYAERWRYRHPSSADFYAVAEEIAQRDLDDFFRQFVEEPGAFDPAVVRVNAERVKERRGHPDTPPDHYLLAADAEPAAPGAEGGAGEDVAEPAPDGDATAAGTAEEDGPAEWRAVIELRHRGEVRLPVTVELRFEEGDPERRTWEGGERWARWEVVRPARLVEVAVDPDDVYALDASRLNNRMRVDSDARPALRSSLRLLFWVQQALAAVGL